MYSKNTTIVLFLIFLALGIAGLILEEILKIGFLLAFSVLAVQGMANNPKDQIIKSILPSMLLAIIICFLSSIVVGIICYVGMNSFLGDVSYGLRYSWLAFYMIVPDNNNYYILLFIPYWIVYLALLSSAVMFVRKKDIKHFPMLGYLLIIFIVGVPFFFLHYLFMAEVFSSAAWMMMHM